MDREDSQEGNICQPSILCFQMVDRMSIVMPLLEIWSNQYEDFKTSYCSVF